MHTGTWGIHVCALFYTLLVPALMFTRNVLADLFYHLSLGLKFHKYLDFHQYYSPNIEFHQYYVPNIESHQYHSPNIEFHQYYSQNVVSLRLSCDACKVITVC